MSSEKDNLTNDQTEQDQPGSNANTLDSVLGDTVGDTAEDFSEGQQVLPWDLDTSQEIVFDEVLGSDIASAQSDGNILVNW